MDILNAIEIDFHNVGQASRGGDAITFRIGKVEAGLWQKQFVFIVDGGDAESGARIVQHIKNVYKTTEVDVIFLSHPDSDHASGLKNVVQSDLTIKELCMHLPWDKWEDCENAIVDGRVTKKSFERRMQEAYTHAHQLYIMCKNKGIKVTEPFSGLSFEYNGQRLISVLGPTKELYIDLVHESEKHGFLEVIAKAFSEAIYEAKEVLETLDILSEKLGEDSETSSENNMSTILHIKVEDFTAILTGDAGKRALEPALDEAETLELPIKNLTIFQVPHHGSRRNITPSILNRISPTNFAITSSPPQSSKHPAKIVTNALIRRDIKPYATMGNTLNYVSNAPRREGLVDATPVSFSSYVEVSD